MKISLLHVSIGTMLCVSLLSIATTADAAFAPEFYEQRRQERIQAQQQVNVEQFDRVHNGADQGIVWRDTGKRGVVAGKGKGTPVVQPPITYIIREEVVLPPLTHTGAGLNILALLAIGLAGGYSFVKRKAQLV